ncbi:hypothetical protein PENSPDRAFT_637974 [Peniophora sp. CONT]|nr:hypothetical protein PENSPDRAFT_637974 [Peniophora sp. CONT]
MSQNIRSVDSFSNDEITRVAGGHKANLSNNNTSDESKQHSRAQLDEIESSGRLETAGHSNADKNMGNVLGGHKATISNPKVSEEAKEHARDILREHDALDEQYA